MRATIPFIPLEKDEEAGGGHSSHTPPASSHIMIGMVLTLFSESEWNGHMSPHPLRENGHPAPHPLIV